jgi:phage shock protein PspC (stress-responsive transcriptional regulator)
MSDSAPTTPPPPPEPSAPIAPPALGADETGPRRLTRSSAHRVLGGVCGGIARRFDTDPVVVRVIFVILALLWGFGILVYLAMWVIVPGDGEPAESEPAEAGRAGWWLRVALPLAILVAVAVVALAVVGRSGAHWARGLGIFWVVCLVLLAVVALQSPSHRFTFRRFVALAFLAFFSVVIVLVSAVLIALSVIGVPIEGGSGLHTWTPATVAQVRAVYRGAYGESRIDLSQVHFGPGVYSVRATQAVGQLIVDVPSDVKVVVTSHVGIGQSATANYTPRAVYPATTPSASAGTLMLNLSVGIGRIEVDQVRVGASALAGGPVAVRPAALGAPAAAPRPVVVILESARA